MFTDFFGSGKFSGYVYVTQNDSIILDKGYGKADFENGMSNTAQTKFDLASLTKQFTALSVMQLEEKKLLNVNDKFGIRKFRPSNKADTTVIIVSNFGDVPLAE